jgi:DNA replication protein DnaC
VREQPQYVYSLLCEAYAAEVRSRGHAPIFTEMTRRVIKELAFFLTDPKDSRFSVMLCGTTGNGKSTLHRAFNRFWSVMIDNHIVQTEHPYMRDAKMFQHIMAYARNWEEVLRMYTWVGIQDMGKEPGESMQWGRITTPVQDLIEYRYDVGLPVFITTNLTAEQIREKYQERTASRLNDMVKVIIFGDIDYRLMHNEAAEDAAEDIKLQTKN